MREIKKEYYESRLWTDYTKRAQKCFDESYVRFSENTEYCYYASRILLHSYYFIGLEVKESLLEAMYQKAQKAGYNKGIDQGRPHDVDEIAWAQQIVHDPSVLHQLATKGQAGEYMVGGVLAHAKEILEKAAK